MKTKTINFCFMLALMSAGGAAHAGDLEVDSHSNISKDTIIKHFSGGNPAAAAVNGSSGDYEGDADIGAKRTIDTDYGQGEKPLIRKHKSKKPGHPATAKQNYSSPVPAMDTNVSLTMDILFPYNSAVLTDAAKKMLKPIGEGLASKELQNISFDIEGYTDAIGGDEFNKTLSEQRAESVKHFLIGEYRVEPSRLVAIGKGESALLNPYDPTSADNRRVRIVAKK